MADTQRDLSALATLLADNTSQSISPQDLRDFMASALGGYGEVLCTIGAGVAQSSIGTTPVAVSGWDANGVSDAGATPDHSNDKVTAVVAGDWHIDAWLSLGTLTASAVYNFEIYTGASPSASGIGGQITTLATPGNHFVYVSGIVTLAAADDVFLYVYSDSSGRAMTPNGGGLRIFRRG